MLKNKFVVSTILLGLCLTLVPAASQAMPASWAPGAETLAKLAHWWDFGSLIGSAPRPGEAPARPVRRQGAPLKNGCGIDPNGKPLCGGG
jgi:hypothetical protein